MRTEKRELMEQFLKDVDAQIAYEPMHAPINEELQAHIEDKAEMYMEFGVEEKLAYEKAIRDMGEPDVLGMQMNETHHLRIAKPLLCLIGVLTLLGFLGNLIGRGELLSGGCYLWGAIVLAVVTIYGYPLLLKYAKQILRLFGIGCGALLAVRLICHFLLSLNGGVFSIRLIGWSVFSPSLNFGILQLLIPALAIIFYRNRKKGFTGFAILFVLEIVSILLARFGWAEHMLVPILTMILSLFGVMLYLGIRGEFAVAKRRGILTAVFGTAGVLVFFCAIQWNLVSENVRLFFQPEKRAAVTNSWDDSYNNVLIRDLLKKAEPFGEIRLNKEELIRYGTGQWYYEDGEGQWQDSFHTFEENITYRMQQLEDPKLENVLPQHYHNNYRIAWWILKYGWIPGLVLMAVLIAAQFVMFGTALKIKNQLGRLTALAAVLTLFIQNLFYFAGNFGFQFGMFGNLPFVSEGWVSITGTMLLAGLVLSAYRFDTVVKESGD